MHFFLFFFKVPNAFHGDDLLYNHVREPQIEVPMYYGGPMIIFGTSDEILFPWPLDFPKAKFPTCQCCRYSYKSDSDDQIFNFLVHPSFLNEQYTTMVHVILPKTTVAVFSMLSPKVLFCWKNAMERKNWWIKVLILLSFTVTWRNSKQITTWKIFYKILWKVSFQTDSDVNKGKNKL